MPRPLLIAAHPGHELMIHAWLADARPRVCIVTDGSGRSGASRLASSERVVRDAGAIQGALWGELSDRAAYRAMLDGDTGLFAALTLRLCEEITQYEPPYVVGDAREGFNPTHDICRMMVDAAARRAGRAGLPIGNYAYALSVPHEASPREGSIVRVLGDEEMNRKLAAAHGYPELSAEVDAIVKQSRRELFAPDTDIAAAADAELGGRTVASLRTECLFPAPSSPPENADRPFYETYGERLAGQGVYDQPVRYREHVKPIEQALAQL
jgi:hypothetical protein